MGNRTMLPDSLEFDISLRNYFVDDLMENFPCRFCVCALWQKINAHITVVFFYFFFSFFISRKLGMVSSFTENHRVILFST